MGPVGDDCGMLKKLEQASHGKVEGEAAREAWFDDWALRHLIGWKSRCKDPHKLFKMALGTLLILVSPRLPARRN